MFPDCACYPTDAQPCRPQGQSKEWSPDGTVWCHAFEQAPATRYETGGADGGAATITAPEMIEILKSGSQGWTRGRAKVPRSAARLSPPWQARRGPRCSPLPRSRRSMRRPGTSRRRLGSGWHRRPRLSWEPLLPWGRQPCSWLSSSWSVQRFPSSLSSGSRRVWKTSVQRRPRESLSRAKCRSGCNQPAQSSSVPPKAGRDPCSMLTVPRVPK